MKKEFCLVKEVGFLCQQLRSGSLFAHLIELSFIGLLPKVYPVILCLNGVLPQVYPVFVYSLGCSSLFYQVTTKILHEPELGSTSVLFLVHLAVNGSNINC